MNSKFDWAFGKIKRLAMQSFALAYAAGSAAIAMEDGQFLTVLASGAVCGLVGLLTSIHRSIATSWQHMWNGMLEENHLSMDWGEEVPLLDLIFFAFTVVKFRRRKNKAAWTGKTLATLKQIQIGILGFLHGAMAVSLREHMQEHNVYDGQVPSRRIVQRRRLLGFVHEVLLFVLKCCSAFGSKCELASLFWRVLLRRAGDQRLGVSRVKMSVHEVWQFLEDAREANVSMRKLAIVRRRDRQGGIRQGSVDLWICKLLSMYKEEARLSFLGSKQLCVVTDASHHSSKDWLISLAYDPLSMNGAYMTAQFVSSSKVIRIGEFDLTPEAERVAARRDQERLSTLRFLQGISSQIQKLTGLVLADFTPPQELQAMLSPLSPGERRSFEGSVLRITAEDEEELCSFDFGPHTVGEVAMLHVLMDQGPVGCAAHAFTQHEGLLIHYSYDWVHRLHRDIKGPLSGELEASVATAAFIWSINYKPFNTGAFFTEKMEALAAFMENNGPAL